ncbi:MAG TPA: VTT domain-containing protein [Kofleriaceae bacterium]|nr:VTT domain-containing protein [Kofleriaceae bacterium]
MRRFILLRLNNWWRAFVLALAAYAVLGMVVLALVPHLAGVFLLGAYCIPANSVIPIPHEPAILYFAKFYDPFWCALAGTIGSLIACFADYAMVGAALRHRALAKTRNSALFQWSTKWMKRYPFAITVLFSFTPLPISIVRILAPAVEYNVRRYMLAQIVGRFPRFYLLALVGHAVMIPNWILIGLGILLLATFFLGARSVEADDDDLDDDEPEPDYANAA